MEATASDYFGNRVSEYDSLIRRCVPRYDEMIERLVLYLPPEPARVVELGCGTGNFSLALAARYPGAQLSLIDASEEMLATARTRLDQAGGGAGQRARLIPARFEDAGLAPESFDLVTSCISLHHVEDKADLYRQLFDALAPGGALVFADQLRGATDAVHDVNWQGWLRFCREPAHCDENEVESLLDHAAAHDHYTPLAEHFRLLAMAGFDELDCVWRNWLWGVVRARKPLA